MAKVLCGQQGTVCLMDNILIFAVNRKEHTQRLYAVLNRIQDAGITLNKSKCQFYCPQIIFCGYVIGKEGIQSDPAKMEALNNMPACKNVADIHRFLGMANQLGRFTPRLSTLSQPLRELLHKHSDWYSAVHQYLRSTILTVRLACPQTLCPLD